MDKDKKSEYLSSILTLNYITEILTNKGIFVDRNVQFCDILQYKRAE